jgi:hypothetical protein
VRAGDDQNEELLALLRIAGMLDQGSVAILARIIADPE